MIAVSSQVSNNSLRMGRSEGFSNTPSGWITHALPPTVSSFRTLHKNATSVLIVETTLVSAFMVPGPYGGFVIM